MGMAATLMTFLHIQMLFAIQCSPLQTPHNFGIERHDVFEAGSKHGLWRKLLDEGVQGTPNAEPANTAIPKEETEQNRSYATPSPLVKPQKQNEIVSNETRKQDNQAEKDANKDDIRVQETAVTQQDAAKQPETPVEVTTLQMVLTDIVPDTKLNDNPKEEAKAGKEPETRVEPTSSHAGASNAPNTKQNENSKEGKNEEGNPVEQPETHVEATTSHAVTSDVPETKQNENLTKENKEVKPYVEAVVESNKSEEEHVRGKNGTLVDSNTWKMEDDKKKASAFSGNEATVVSEQPRIEMVKSDDLGNERSLQENGNSNQTREMSKQDDELHNDGSPHVKQDQSTQQDEHHHIDGLPEVNNTQQDNKEPQFNVQNASGSDMGNFRQSEPREESHQQGGKHVTGDEASHPAANNEAGSQAADLDRRNEQNNVQAHHEAHVQAQLQATSVDSQPQDLSRGNEHQNVTHDEAQIQMQSLSDVESQLEELKPELEQDSIQMQDEVHVQSQSQADMESQLKHLKRENEYDAAVMGRHERDPSEEDYSDLIQELAELPLKLQETAGKVADHLRPDVQKWTDTSKVYFNMANQQIEESVLPLIGRNYAPFVASMISYSMLLLPLMVVIVLFEHIKALLSLQKILLFANIYLAAYFATLWMASYVIGLEPMSFFYLNSLSSYLSLQLLQALGYILYLILQTANICSACTSDTLIGKICAATQWAVSISIGLHYYVAVFHPAVTSRAPRTNWKMYAIYSVAFFLLCLCARVRWVKKRYIHSEDGLANKKN